MKFLKITFCFLLVSSIISCSSDGGSSSAADSFNLVYNGTNINITEMVAQKSENSLVVYGTADNGMGVQIEFNKFGNLGRISVFNLTDETFVDKDNYEYFKSNYFNFDLTSINESSERVKGNFSGTVYEDETDMTTSTAEISGNFDLKYIVQTPVISGIETYCKIGGSDWYGTDLWDNGWWSIDRKVISDDNKILAFEFEDEMIETGTYNFTPSSVNKVYLGVFNTTTKTYDYYNCSGTLNITGNTDTTIGSLIEGTFSFTATNPSNTSQQIQVTNGKFKEHFSL